MASSIACSKFKNMVIGAKILSDFQGKISPSCGDQHLVDQTCLKAAVANAVGCWEGYIEEVLREFVSKVRVQADRRAWTLIAQYEALVDKLASDLNTPNWDKARELILTVSGMDPYASWIWSEKFPNQNDTKVFFDGVMRVRHAFAHGFPLPRDIPGVATSGVLDVGYVGDVLACITFFVDVTDALLEHELTHRHSCASGWA